MDPGKWPSPGTPRQANDAGRRRKRGQKHQDQYRSRTDQLDAPDTDLADFITTELKKRR